MFGMPFVLSGPSSVNLGDGGRPVSGVLRWRERAGADERGQAAAHGQQGHPSSRGAAGADNVGGLGDGEVPAVRARGAEQQRRQRQPRHAKVKTAAAVPHVEQNAALARRAHLRQNLQIVADNEPFAAVDPHTVEELQQEVSKLRDLGISILVTDHNVQQTLRICDRAYIIHHGLNLRDGDPRTIINDEQVREAYLASTFKGDEFD